MNIKDFCVSKKQTLKEVMKVIDTTGYGVAFVTENKKLLGVATDSDIRRALLEGVTLEAPVENVMNKNPITLTEEESKNISLEKFPVYGMTQVPIIDKQNNIKDVLLISKKEVVGHLLNGKKRKQVKCVLVVGGAGYLGSILCKKLLTKGYKVKILDNLTYGDVGLKPIYYHPDFEFCYGDICNIKDIIKAIKGVDAVIHLAAIVGDPASNLNPEKTIESNYLASKTLAEVCKYSQINRFIFASTCSVYGAAKPGCMLTETSLLNPVSLYANMKLKSEQGILELEDDNFSPTVLRMGTLYGMSSKMRFDLVINTLTIKALKEHQFTIFGGEQWRALCHVRDAANAYIKCLEVDIKDVKGQVFNVVTDNKQIKELGQIVKSIIPTAKQITKKDKVDIRNYAVSSKKIKKLGFKKTNTIQEAIHSIRRMYKYAGFWSDYPHKKYSNYEYLREEYGN